MARPLDPNRKRATLAAATDYVLEHGLAGLSLRPLASALGTSPRMLLYDFGSKEELVAEVLGDARRREAALLADWLKTPGATPDAMLRAIWRWIAAPDREPFVRLFFEVYIDAAKHPEAYGGAARAMVDDWVDFLRASWLPAGVDAATATLMVAVVRGLLLDRLAAADPRRTDEAIELFANLLTASEARRSD